MPATSLRWKTNASNSGGSTASTPAAAITVYCVLKSVAKFAATTGIVFAALVLVRNNANMNSFHAVMNEKTAAATRPGAATGRNTDHIVRNHPQRSTRAASSSSLGTDRKKSLRIQIVIGSAKVV